MSQGERIRKSRHLKTKWRGEVLFGAGCRTRCTELSRHSSPVPSCAVHDLIYPLAQVFLAAFESDAKKIFESVLSRALFRDGLNAEERFRISHHNERNTAARLSRDRFRAPDEFPHAYYLFSAIAHLTNIAIVRQLSTTTNIARR